MNPTDIITPVDLHAEPATKKVRVDYYMTHAEIARETGWSLKEVKQLEASGLRKLRRNLGVKM